MKKLLIASLCAASFALVACDKKPADANAPATKTETKAAALSTNNVEDIKNDYNQLQTLTTAKAQDGVKFQEEVITASQSNDKAALKGISEKLKAYVDNFNKELDSLPIKSSEVNSLREKMKEANTLGIELSQISTETAPDTNKITELTKRATDLQQETLTQMQDIQAKINTAAAK